MTFQELQEKMMSQKRNDRNNHVFEIKEQDYLTAMQSSFFDGPFGKGDTVCGFKIKFI